MHLLTQLVSLQLDKARRAYHKVSRKEHAAREREAHSQGNPDVAGDKQKKIQEDRELTQQEAEKVSSTFCWSCWKPRAQCDPMSPSTPTSTGPKPL